MKVAFLGNMNNNGFAIARFLRDRGVDADVLLFDNEAEHFHPSADCFDDSFQSFCKSLTWGTPARWAQVRHSTIERDIRRYDVIIGTGLAPAFCLRVGRPLDVFVPYGADLYHYTRYHATYPNRIIGTWAAVRVQRQAIPRCSVFHMDMTNPIYEERWARYRGRSERLYCGIPAVYTGLYTTENAARLGSDTRWSGEFRRIRAESDLLLFSHVRHVWGGPSSDPNQKGTDRLLRGVALFKARHPQLRVNLITFEYGTCVSRSKALVTRLGLQQSVHWFPTTLRKDLMCGILHSDIVCAEFENSWLCSGVIYEALAMAKPIVGFRTDDLYREHYRQLYPLLNARSPESICARLEECLSDPEKHRAMGERGCAWYHDYVVEPVLRKYLAVIGRRAPRAEAAALVDAPAAELS